MRYLLIILLIISGQDIYSQCHGSSPCSSCTNCKRCKHCKSGGVCGACSPGNSSTKTKIIKNNINTTPTQHKTNTNQTKPSQNSNHSKSNTTSESKKQHDLVESDSIQKKDIIFTVVEEMPDFPGGQLEKNRFIQKNLILPESIIKNNTFGKCFLKFTIRKDGSISDIIVLKGVPSCPECDIEAKRVISIMPNWIPGKQNGKAVSVYYNIPINFQLK